MSKEVISSNFKRLRKNLKLSQEQLGEYLEKSRVIINYYENNERDIPLEVLEKASDLFGVELHEFFSKEPPIGIATAFRTEKLEKTDLDEISRFKRIMKNFQRINRLSNKL